MRYELAVWEISRGAENAIAFQAKHLAKAGQHGVLEQTAQIQPATLDRIVRLVAARVFRQAGVAAPQQAPPKAVAVLIGPKLNIDTSAPGCPMS